MFKKLQICISNLHVLTPHTYAIGNCAEHIYFGLLRARRSNSKLLLLWPFELFGPFKFNLTNSEILHIESENLLTLNPAILFTLRLALTAYYLFIRIISLILRIVIGRHLPEIVRDPMIGVSNLWSTETHSLEYIDQYHSPLNIKLNNNKCDRAKIIRAEMGIPDNEWFACLHVREGGFLSDHGHERNADINNYIEAITEIINRGGWVVRIGDSSMTQLPKLNRVIDYPFTKYKSDLMDLYLVSNCKLYLGMASGPYEMALLFNRDMIIVNMVSWLFQYPIKKNDVALFKHVYCKEEKRFLGIREWLNFPVDAMSIFSASNQYEFHENSPSEIRQAVVEFFDGERDDALQMQFSKLRNVRGEYLLNQVDDRTKSSYFDFYSKLNLTQKLRFMSRLTSARGIISPEFLRKNWER